MKYYYAVQALDDGDRSHGADRRFAAEACFCSDGVRAADDSRQGSRSARELPRESEVLNMPEIAPYGTTMRN